MYCIISDLETLYNKIDDIPTFKTLTPRIPRDAMAGEDDVTPRVCAARTIRECVSAIGLMGRFRRCLAANESAKSYAETENEAYPILVLRLSDSARFFRPSAAQVPDADKTGELWSLQPVRVLSQEIRWLAPWSIQYDEDDERTCTLIQTMSTERVRRDGYDHPWINGHGHPLESSQMDYETWPGEEPGLSGAASRHLWYDRRIGRRPVMAYPVSNAYAMCLPLKDDMTIDPDAKPYRAALEDLVQYAGCRDDNGEHLFEGDSVMDPMGRTWAIVHKAGCFGIEPRSPGCADGFRTLFVLDRDSDGRLIGMTLC